MLYRLISGRSRAVLNRKAQPGGTALTAADIIEPVRTCHASGIAPDGATADCAAIDAALAPQRKRFYSGLLPRLRTRLRTVRRHSPSGSISTTCQSGTR